MGRTAVHVALAHGAHVIAGVRESQRAKAAVLGAQQVLALDNEQELETAHDLDAVADTVGGALQTRILRTLRDGGVYGSVVGPPAQPAGRDIRVETMMAVPDTLRLFQLAEEVARGLLTIPTAKIFPLSEIREATRLAEGGGAEGKIVLVP